MDIDSTQNLITGLQLLLSHMTNPSGVYTSSDYDGAIVFDATDAPLTPEECEQMLSWGWEQIHNGTSSHRFPYTPSLKWVKHL